VTGCRRVVVLGQLDGYANGVRPVQVARFLQARGHDVRLVDTYRLSRASTEAGSRGARLPAARPAAAALYAVEAAGAVLRRLGGRRRLSYPLLLAELRLRRRILRATLDLAGVDLLVAETPHDAAVLVGASVHTLYDCPTPWADELWYEGLLTRRQHGRLRRRETDLFEAVDHLAFHWESYGRYVREHYRISGANLVTLNWGCTPAERARPAEPARVVYLGSLSSRFIDLPLLARLSRAYPHLDVYGGPPPDPTLGLRYRGHADPAILRDYQFGLVTCTDDALRRDGFSAKHLHYLAAGLPVLVPSWRRSARDLAGSLPYDEGSFLAVLARHSAAAAWQRASDAAYAQAGELTWDRTLAPLEALLAAGTGQQDGSETATWAVPPG
jgi:hypothetical protein